MLFRRRPQAQATLPLVPSVLGAIALTAAALLAASPVEAAAPVKGPWLQALSSSGVSLRVELDVAAPVEAVLVDPKGTERRVADSQSTQLHALRVQGLEPATRYTYRFEGLPGAEGAFTTAPIDGRPFSFLVYGDSRTDPEAHASVIRGMLAEPSDFLVQTGDMVAHGNDLEEWEEFFRIEGPLLRNRCVFSSVGNHELVGWTGGSMPFLRYFGDPDGDGREPERLYDTVRWGNTRFFLLNAMDEWTGPERDWLRAELDRARLEPGLVHRIAVLHHGAFSSGPHGGNRRLAEAGILPLLREGQVDLLLAGHDHLYERGEGQGLKYVLAGGAGAPLYPVKKRTPEAQRSESTHHYVIARVDGDLVRITAKRASGSVLETCEFKPGQPWVCEGQGAPTPPKGSSERASAAVSPSSPAGRSCRCELQESAREGARGWATAAAALAVSLLGLRRKLRPAPRRRDPGPLGSSHGA